MIRPYTAAEHNLVRFLRLVAILHALVLILGAIGAYTGPANPFWREPPWVSNAVASAGVMMLLAWLGAADIHRYRSVIHLLIGGLAFEAVACFAIWITFGSAYGEPFLIILVIAALLSGSLALLARQAPASADYWRPWMPEKNLTQWEQIVRALCWIGGIGSCVAVAAHFILPASGPEPLRSFLQQPVMILGSAVKIGVLGMCLLLAASNLRQNRHFVTLFIVGNALSMVIVIITHLGINRFGPVAYPALRIDSRGIMLGALAVDVTAVGAFLLLQQMMERSLLNHTRFFSADLFRALESTADTLIEGEKRERVPAEQIVLRVDSYLSSFHSGRLWLAKAAVFGLDAMPLALLQPPLQYQRPESRRNFLDWHFKRAIVEKRSLYGLLHRLRWNFPVDVIEAMMRFNMQLTYIGYYSQPSVQTEIGYTPFSQRPLGKQAKRIPGPHPGLNVITPADLRRTGTDTLKADVVIIGSGAAGSILAEQLAAQGREVLIIERGPYIPPQDFSEDEVEQISRLYSDGALQISQSLRFTILQGSCVGGTTVVNNAVCFNTPDEVLAHWNDPAGTDAQIDVTAYRTAQEKIRAQLAIKSISDSSSTHRAQAILNPGDAKIDQGVQAYLQRTGKSWEYGVVEANITDCLGCGYCNIGCQYGRKLSMLDAVLPQAQQQYGERFRILTEAEVKRIQHSGHQVTALEISLRDGRSVTIAQPKTVVLSAGAIASSWLLMRSSIGQGELPVGQYLSFNMGSPLHGCWNETLNSFAGLQIAHYLKPPTTAGFVYETWFNPPVAQALAMPGWLDTHFMNMEAYNRMAAVGVLVGTEPTAHLTRALFMPGAPDIVYKPTTQDLSRLVEALCVLGEILFEAGAETVMASTRHYRSYGSGCGIYTAGQRDSFADDLRKLVQDERDILLGTGHPQGGNRISGQRGHNGKTGGVVNPDFKVYGFDNLYVCDASVFPSATTVNPQLSVMTMAQYAASRIH
jgi:choline dehydrogenase-like flavoprotein